MSKYYQFSKKHFEYELKGILMRNKAGFMEDITDKWLKEGNETWERVYKVTTRNKAVNIIIFSSVDMRTNEVRDNGTDRVRVVLQWNTKRGPIYKKIHHHNRLSTLFKNLEQTLINIQPQVFNLNFKEFSKTEVE
jgi:hypothetical protein